MTEKTYIWDPLIRIFHWTLMLAFVTSYLTGDELETVHVYSGYLILSLLLFRIIWGFIGSYHARFGNFIRPFGDAVAYLRGLRDGSSQRYLGHNPAGGLMVLALLVSLSMTGLSGLKLYGVEGHGPLASTGALTVAGEQTRYSDDNDRYEYQGYAPDKEKYDEDERDEHDQNHDQHEADEESWEELHEFFANLSVLLVLLHIAGVFVSSLAHGENLVRAMITGYKDRKS